MITLNYSTLFEKQSEDNYLTYSTDPIVLSCALQRIRIDDYAKNLWTSARIEDHSLADKILPDDIQKANDIRRYYGEQLILKQLRGDNLTEFKKDLSLLIANDTKQYKQSWTGIIYRLPYFYDYDVELDSLSLMFPLASTHQPDSEKNFAILKPVKKIRRSVRGSDKYSYYFEIENTGIPAKIEVDSKNTMLAMWDTLFEMGHTMHVSGDYKWLKQNEFGSYLITKQKILNLKLD